MGNEQALAALKTQTVEMQAELDALRELYTDDAENVRTLRRRLEAMQRRLAEGLSASVQAVSSLGSLERQRALAQDRYNEVQKKLDQIKLYLRLNPSDAESRVIVDAPSRPLDDEGKKRVVVALIGPVAGLLLGLLLAGLRELSDQRLQSRRDVRQALGLPVLGAWPARPADASESERSMANDDNLSLPRLGLAVLDRLAEIRPDGRVVLVTSARSREGKTFVAQALARQLQALTGGRVVLVEATLTGKPKGGASGGFAGLLAQGTPPEGALRASADAEQVLFQPGPVARALQWLRGTHDLVVVDGPNLPRCGSLALQSDATVLVVDAAATPRRRVQEALLASRLLRRCAPRRSSPGAGWPASRCSPAR
ncbi:hypothetical protein ABXN37_11915 [Piscinibacter sakaiensis]|uniref:hypothetical protein n=1 Tax=Piscinibacter sakaiensis TaxID=1547922 RepID=UPI00372B0F1C